MRLQFVFFNRRWTVIGDTCGAKPSSTTFSASKRTVQRYLICPANHPKFLSQKGCNFLLRLHPSWRSQIDSSSSDFATHYKKRTSVERLFSRLLAIVMQQPTVRGLGAIRNHCTIAHISVLLVATAAHHLGHPDKLAFVRSFVPNFLIDR